MTTILTFLAVFIPLVMIHELGHFAMAKLFRVKVMEFGLGLPPRLWGFRKGETLYSINALPLGGFVKMLGEEDPTDPRSLAAQRAWKRAIVLGAGAFMNAVLALVLFAVVLMTPQTVTVGDITVKEVAPDSPAAAAGLQPGDVIREMGGRKIETEGDLIRQVQLSLGGDTGIVLQRGTELVRVSLTPRWEPPPGQGPIGIVREMNNTRQVSRSDPFWEAAPNAGRQMADSLILMKNGIASWFVGERSPQDDALGPVGIARVTGEVADIGFVAVLLFAALLSLNLAIFNILPFPALDGGRLFFLAIEVARRGKRIPPQKEALVHLAGFAILIGLFVIVTFNDIARIVRGESALGG